MELFKTYEHVLSEDSVMDHFRGIINKVVKYQLFFIVSTGFSLVSLMLYMIFVKSGQEVCKA